MSEGDLLRIPLMRRHRERGLVLSRGPDVRGVFRAGAVESIRRVWPVLAVIQVALLLAGCGLSSAQTAGESISELVDAALKPEVGHEIAVVNFDTLIAGSWKELVIVCRGSSQASLNDSLGFEWETGPDLADSNFLAMLVFSTGTKVEKYFSAGEDDAYVDHWYFTPCSVPTDSGYRPGIGPIVLERQASTMTFHFEKTDDPRFSFWYVSAKELQNFMH